MFDLLFFYLTFGRHSSCVYNFNVGITLRYIIAILGTRATIFFNIPYNRNMQMTIYIKNLNTIFS
jgi:hypothetical protein